MRAALIGYTGFVGTTLTRAMPFEGLYNSRNINEISGKAYDLVVCAAAPATMWAANQNPEADKANLDRLFAAMQHASAGRFVLISTIAVLDNPSAGYVEATAVYEVAKAYGRHRRELEEKVAGHFPRSHILRLPALFGPGLKKNFLFDLMNPAPSFIKREMWTQTLASLPAADADLLSSYYAMDAGLNMWGLDRARLNASPDRIHVDGVFHRINFVARNFTNSASCFQYYNMLRLAGDIETVLNAGLDVVNICSEPLKAAQVCEALTGEPFENSGPPLVQEDMRSSHAAVFGGAGPYLFDGESVLADLKAFFAAASAA